MNYVFNEEMEITYAEDIKEYSQLHAFTISLQ